MKITPRSFNVANLVRHDLQAALKLNLGPVFVLSTAYVDRHVYSFMCQSIYDNVNAVIFFLVEIMTDDCIRRAEVYEFDA